MTSLALVAILASALLGTNTSAEPGAQALVVVALPANATHAMSEALNRLRGEAIAVGFEVRLVDASTETLSLAQLDGISAGLRPAAVVAISRPAAGASAAHALDVWFLDRTSGKASVAHLDASDVAETPERAEVVVAVRAVDFIRARMFDTLASRRSEKPPSPPTLPKGHVVQRYDVAMGLAVLGVGGGFAPSLAPQLAAAFRPTPWLRLGLTAFGLGSNPKRTTQVGTVSLEQRYLGAWLGVLGPVWHRLRPALELGGGGHWLVASGQGKPPYVGLSKALVSPAVSFVASVSVELTPHLALELRGGTLWLQSRGQVCALEASCFDNLGWPVWLGSLMLAARL